MAPIGCPETSVRNYHDSLHNNPEEHSSHLLRDEIVYFVDCSCELFAGLLLLFHIYIYIYIYIYVCVCVCVLLHISLVLSELYVDLQDR